RLIGSSAQRVYAPITCRLERDLDVAEMRREAGEWAVGLSRFGVAARAIVFALLGWGLVVAGWFRDVCEGGTTARTGPLASRRHSSRFRRLRLLSDHPRALFAYPTQALTDGPPFDA